MTGLRTRGFQLHSWQQSAVDAWQAGTDSRRFKGTLEIVTGGGKTLIALACAARAAQESPDLRLVVVVPTEALARQWRQAITRFTTLTSDEVGLLGAGGKDDLRTKRALVAVLNTASKKLPGIAASSQPLMLVVDECHRAGAPSYSRVLSTPAAYRLGLSATPDREELDEEGQPLRYDEQAVGRSLGGVVYRFSLKDARRAGWLPDYTLHHHAVSLTAEERTRYDVVSRRIDDAADELRAHGGDTARSRQLAGRQDAAGDAARRWIQLTGLRKDLLYRCSERQRVAVNLVRGLFTDPESSARAILFHERVDEAVELWKLLRADLPQVPVALEHSRLRDAERQSALSDFAAGTSPVLVSVKSLVEGIDVPEADTGISVASTSSVRQRVQSLGRVLRRSVDAEGREKTATMHLIYVGDTVDDQIYGKADWTDLTGEGANRYWRWQPAADAPIPEAGPPRTPRPTEEQAWEQLGRPDTGLPVPWPGVLTGQEYSVDTAGVVHNAFGRLIENPQDVASMVSAVRGRPGGRFTVTPSLSLVLVWSLESGDPEIHLAGRLSEDFRVAPEVEDVQGDVVLDSLAPGDRYPGPTDKRGGTYKLSQRGGGTIERSVRRGKEAAQTDGIGPPEQLANARRILATWDQLNRPVSKFFVNSLGHAWFEAAGGRHFLALVPDGFAWPSDEENSRDDSDALHR